jgi:transposase
MSPDLNPIEHIWDMLGRRIQAREPYVQNIRRCTDHQLGCLLWRLNSACSHERYTPKPLLSLHRKGQLAGCSLGYRLYV